MACHFSLKSFLRLAPNHLLRQYLAQRTIDESILWDCLSETNMESVYRAIENAQESVRVDIEADFRLIHEMADERGVQTLLGEAGHSQPDINLRSILEKYSPLGFVFKTFLEHRTIFDVGRRFDYAHGLKFEKRGGLPEPCRPFDETVEARLKRDLSEYFRQEQGRGRGCKIDVYQRGNRHYYFCSLEDYPETRIVFDEDHQLTTEKQKTAFDLIFIHNLSEHSLETRVKGGRLVRGDVETIFGRVVLGMDLGDPPGRGVVYNLNPLMDKTYKFPVHAGDGIDQVVVRSLRLKILGREHRVIKLEVGARSPETAVWELLDLICASDGIQRDLLSVIQAQIRVVMLSDKNEKKTIHSFTVSYPDSCSLKSDPEDEILKDCLRRWNLDVSGTAGSNPPLHGGPAQYRLWP